MTRHHHALDRRTFVTGAFATGALVAAGSALCGCAAAGAGTGDDAQASEAVEATLTGPELEIAFNPHFLLDGLGAVGTAYTRISFTQPSRPAVLSGQDEADGDADTSYRYVLMPVRFAS